MSKPVKPKTKQHYLNVPISKELVADLDQFKFEYGVSKKVVVQIALTKYLKSRLK